MAKAFSLRNGTILISTEAPGGLYNSLQLKKIASLCDDDAAIVKATEDQRLALFVKEEQASSIAESLKEIGLGIRNYQDGLHQPVSCIGELCGDHEIDALGSAMDLTRELEEISLSSPLKIGINGCHQCCVPCHTLDISIVGDMNGYRMSIGGKTSQLPEMASFIAEGVPKEKLSHLVKEIVLLYKELAEEGESLQHVIERVGAADFIKILHPYSQDAADQSDDLFGGTELDESPELVSEENNGDDDYPIGDEEKQEPVGMADDDLVLDEKEETLVDNLDAADALETDTVDIDDGSKAVLDEDLQLVEDEQSENSEELLSDDVEESGIDDISLEEEPMEDVGGEIAPKEELKAKEDIGLDINPNGSGEVKSQLETDIKIDKSGKVVDHDDEISISSGDNPEVSEASALEVEDGQVDTLDLEGDITDDEIDVEEVSMDGNEEKAPIVGEEEIAIETEEKAPIVGEEEIAIDAELDSDLIGETMASKGRDQESDDPTENMEDDLSVKDEIGGDLEDDMDMIEDEPELTSDAGMDQLVVDEEEELIGDDILAEEGVENAAEMLKRDEMNEETIENIDTAQMDQGFEVDEDSDDDSSSEEEEDQFEAEVTESIEEEKEIRSNVGSIADNSNDRLAAIDLVESKDGDEIEDQGSNELLVEDDELIEGQSFDEEDNINDEAISKNETSGDDQVSLDSAEVKNIEDQKSASDSQRSSVEPMQVNSGDGLDFSGVEVTDSGLLSLKFVSGAYLSVDVTKIKTNKRTLSFGGQEVNITICEDGYRLEVDGVEFFYPKSKPIAAA